VPSITLSLTQPLLRGAGSDIATEVLTQAERNVVYEIRDFTHFRNEFALEIFGDYLNLLQLGQSMRLSYTNYQNRIFFRQEVEARAEGGLAAEFESKQALQSEYTAKLSYVGTVNGYRNNLDNLKQKLVLPLSTNLKLDFKVLDDLREMGLPEMPLDEISGYRLALDKRLDLMNVIDRFEDSKRKVKVARSDLLPGLSIVADAALRNQFYSSFKADSIETKAGLKLNLPFDRLSERNAYRSSLIVFERQLRTLSTELDKLLDGLRSDFRNLSRQRQNYFTQLEARKNSEENLEATRQRLRLGFPGVRTRDVITAQDALLQSQLSVLGAGLEYHKTRLKLLKDVGALESTQDEFWLKNIDISEFKQTPPEQLPQPLEEVIPPEQILGQ
jgi:outer membrane protein TolC